jgi:hypothetical protein
MKRVIHLTAVFLAAGVALLIVAGAVYSSPQSDPPLQALHQPDEYVYTRMVTITVYSSTVALTPGLISRWQFRTLDQVISYTFDIPLPDDAYEISVALPMTSYRIDPGPTLIITGPQLDLYYEYKTGQRALRFGNQILITQAASNNQSYRYLATLTFTDHYQYVGTSGFAPTATAAHSISWDVVPQLDPDARYRFNASTWLWDPRLMPPVLARPDLEIFTATVDSDFDHIIVTATIRNNGPMTAWAPPYINLYDRIAPFLPPAGPLDLTGGWCSMMPESACGISTTNPLSPVPPGQTVIFTAEHDLSPVNGRHDIYLLIDALGGSQGLNVESAENNNVILAASLLRLGERTFLPLIRR